MFLNNKIQSFLVKRIGIQGVSKYTYSEITSVEEADYMNIEDNVYKKNDADVEFKYFFNV